ncbi:hypothetical protein E6H35_09405 [Candidatus Bathyarchaeota archaeon]|nr:MAG: hypothetical protein E6H35_09405 [Candidatus Bathyarchaeota archaeon]
MLSFSEVFHSSLGMDTLFSTEDFSKSVTYYTDYASPKEYMSSVNIKVGRPATFAPDREMLECYST